MGKWTGAVLQMIGAGLLVAAGGAHAWEPLLVLGLAFGVGGLWSWDRGARKQLQPSPPRPKTPAPDVAERMARLEDVLGTMQADVEKLTEDREFYQRLYAGQGEPGAAERAEPFRSR